MGPRYEEMYGEKDPGSGEAPMPGRSGDARSPRGHRPGSARREHHGVREAVQRPDPEPERDGDPLCGHHLRRPDLHLHHQDSPGPEPPAQGGRDREGERSAQPDQGRAGHPCPGQEDRGDQDGRSQCLRPGQRHEDDRRDRAIHGAGGGGLMATQGKKFRAAVAKVDRTREYPIPEAVSLVKGAAFAKFDETVDVAVNLGVDPRHADQVVRGTVVLPHGTGKPVRVLVITQGDRVREAEAAGADFVGIEYIQKLKDGWLECDVIVATPDVMGQLGQLGRVLGPRGLMPNPKAGTVTMDVAKAVREIKAGKIEFRVDKTGNVHVPIGKVSFSPSQLAENVQAFMDTIVRAKRAAAKGTYIRSATVSSTMGPGVRLETAGYR